MKGIHIQNVSGAGRKVVIVQAQWNAHITDELAARASQALTDAGVASKDIVHVHVPGSFELPFGAATLIDQHTPDAVICIGVLIKGETAHFEYIASAVSEGLMDVQLQTKVPIIFGVLTCFTEEQAIIRAQKDQKDHGYEWGVSALRMAAIKNTK